MFLQVFFFSTLALAVTAQEVPRKELTDIEHSELNVDYKKEPTAADGKRILGWVDRCVEACAKRAAIDSRPAFHGRYPKYSITDGNCLCVSFVPQSQDPDYKLCKEFKCKSFCNGDIKDRIPINIFEDKVLYRGGECFPLSNDHHAGSWPWVVGKGGDDDRDMKNGNHHHHQRCGCGSSIWNYPLLTLPSDNTVQLVN